MKILVLGANGLLGQAIAKRLIEQELYLFGKEKLNILEHGTMVKALETISPDIVINCAAATQVDLCETNRQWAYELNAQAPKNLARLCGRKLIHISTDYVFDGKKNAAYFEEDKTNPINYYGETKLCGETEVLAQGGTVVRTQWLYGAGKKGFVDWVTAQLKQATQKQHSQINVIQDCYGCPTYANDLADQLSMIALRIQNNETMSLLHAANSGATSWYGFAQEICKIFGSNTETTVELRPINAAEVNREARRPKYSVLSSKILTMRPWQDAIQEYLQGGSIKNLYS